MSMSIGPMSGNPIDASDRKNRRQDFEALAKALKAGDLDAAKQAMAKIQKNAPAGAPKDGGPLADVFKALQDGDLASAQKAFAALRPARGPHRPDDAAPLPVRGPNGTGTLLNEIA